MLRINLRNASDALAFVRWFSQVAILLGCVLCSPAPAQGVKDLQGNRITPGAKLEHDKFGNSIPVWIAYDEYSALSGPNSRSEPTGYKFKFMEAALLIRKEKNTQDGLTYALVGTSANDQTASGYRGWVDTRFLLEETRGARRPTGVLQKCMLVNRLSIIQNAKKSDENRPDLVPVTLKPEANAPVAMSFQLNNVFIVYRALDTHVLIGTAEVFNPGLERSVIKGWVPISRISSWDTALALEWDYETASKRDIPGLVVSDLDVARKLRLPDEPRPSKDDEVLLFSEPLANGKTKKFEKGVKRYPILSEREAEALLKDDPSKRDQAKLLNVGVFSGSTGSVDLADLNEKLNRLIQNTAKVDILFIVDDSEGMEIAFPKVAEAIGEIAELFRAAGDATGDSQRDVRLAVSYYADKEWSNKPFKPGTWVSLKRPVDVEKLRTEVTSHRQDGGFDNAEDVFDGIDAAIDAARFSPNRRHVIFVVGDMGDKCFSSSGPDGAVYKDKLDKLSKRFVPQVGEPAELFAIQVKSRLATAPEYKWFEQQMNELAKMINKRWQAKSGQAISIGSFTRADEIDGLILSISNRAKQTKIEMDELIDLARNGLAGNWTAIPSPASSARLKNYEIEWKDLAKKGGFEIYEEGFLWTHSPQSNRQVVQQTRGTVLVDEQSVRDLQLACQSFAKFLGAKAGPRRLDKGELNKVIDRIRNVLIRERGGEEDLSKFFLDRALPVKSPLFKLRDVAGTDGLSLTQEHVIDIMVKSLRLKDIIDGQDNQWKIEVIKQTTGGDILVPVAERKVETTDDGKVKPLSTGKIDTDSDRWFSLEGDPNRLRYIYLDLEREIP